MQLQKKIIITEAEDGTGGLRIIETQNSDIKIQAFDGNGKTLETIFIYESELVKVIKALVELL